MSSCPFYDKRCSLVAPCCGTTAEDHNLPRQLLRSVECNRCHHQQLLSKGDSCLSCRTLFAAYFCPDCGIANNNVPAEGYFHCDACGICRVGSRQEYFHCQGCNCCLRRHYQGNHVCRPGALDAPCPICLQGPMFDSQSAAHMLPCGHFAHLKCINSCSGGTPADGLCKACSPDDSARHAIAGLADMFRASNIAYSAFAGSSSSGASTPQRLNSTSRTGISSGSNVGRGGGSGYVQDLLGVLSGSYEPSDAAASMGTCRIFWESMLQDLLDAGQALQLPPREVRFFTDVRPRFEAASTALLGTHPKLFRQKLEAAILRSVLITQAEDEAKGRAVNAVAQLLMEAGSSNVLRLPDGRGTVSVDRVAVGGSVGKSVSIQGLFDVDLIAFVNIPKAAGINISAADPDSTQNSTWIQGLREQVGSYLGKKLALGSSSMRLMQMPQLARTAVKLTLAVSVPESGEDVRLDVDVLLAPNMAAGAGAVEAARWGVSSNTADPPAVIQCKAVLAPVLAMADHLIKVRSAVSRSELKSILAGDFSGFPAIAESHARSIWLTEATTEFTQQAAVAAAERGLSGRVVTSTIRLVKAWVKKGLAGRAGSKSAGFEKLKSFMLELLVLHAAERFARNLHPSYGGRYVLDLLFEVLQVMTEWADRAEAGRGGPAAPVLFTELARGRYYSTEQALMLQQLSQDSAKWADRLLFSVQPVVVHPVDPLCSVFSQDGVARFTAWGQLQCEAQLLLQQLRECSWDQIMRDSTLGAALAV